MGIYRSVMSSQFQMTRRFRPFHQNQLGQQSRIMKKIPKIFCLVLMATSLVLVPFVSVRAQTNDPNSVTNYPVGACVKNPKGGNIQWQQLADGSWAPSGDPLNFCETGGLPSNWLDSTQYNPWLRSGLDYEFPYTQNIGYYPWGTNYPGGYSNYNDYFLNCVLARTIVARPECQAFPRIGDFYLNPYNSTNSLTVAGTIEGIPISAQIPLTEKVANVVKTVAMGWTLSQLFK